VKLFVRVAAYAYNAKLLLFGVLLSFLRLGVLAFEVGEPQVQLMGGEYDWQGQAFESRVLISLFGVLF